VSSIRWWRLGRSARAAIPTLAPPYGVQTRDWGAVRELEGERAGCRTDARAAVCRPNDGIGLPCTSSRVGSRGLQDRRPCRRVSSKREIAPCVQARDRGAVHELEGGSARAAGPTPMPPCVVRTRDCGIGVPCASSRMGVGAHGLRDRRLRRCVSSEHGIAPCVIQTRDRGAVRELGDGSARAAGRRPCRVSSERGIAPRPSTISIALPGEISLPTLHMQPTGTDPSHGRVVSSEGRGRSSRCSETVRGLARHSGAQILQCRAARVPFSACTLDVFAGRVRRTPQSRNGAGAPGTSASTLHGSAQMRRRWGAAPTTAASQGAARSACGDIHRIWGGASGAPEKVRAHE
jgi:hypothetical protein